MDIDFQTFTRHQSNGNTISEYLNYLKTIVPDPTSHKWIEFEESICSQAVELSGLKKKSETLRNALGKSQETQRELQLELVAEKSLRDQSDRHSKLLIEKSTVELKAQIHTMKYEVESWKQKAECTAMELQLLKEQIKTLEFQKAGALRNLNEIAETNNGYDSFRKSFDALVCRIRETVSDLSRQISEGAEGKDELENLFEAYKEEINVLNVHVKTEQANKLLLESKNDELESDVTTLKTESIRVKMDLINQLNQTISDTHKINSVSPNVQLLSENIQIKQKLGSYEDIADIITETHEKLLPDMEKLLTSVKGKLGK